MPYFTFEITEESATVKKLKQLDTFEKYRDARAYCREQRKTQDLAKNQQIKMVHANTINEAERLLTTVREAPVIGDD